MIEYRIPLSKCQKCPFYISYDNIDGLLCEQLVSSVECENELVKCPMVEWFYNIISPS